VEATYIKDEFMQLWDISMSAQQLPCKRAVQFFFVVCIHFLHRVYFKNTLNVQ